jgi:glutamate synthase domain-containing protein 1
MIKEGQIRIPSGCAISGIFSKSGKKINGENIIKSISVMHDRSNGLGGGFAAYGIYPENRDFFALHVFFDHSYAKKDFEEVLESRFDIVSQAKIPTQRVKEITAAPMIWRYFVTPLPSKLADSQLDENEYTAKCVFSVNTTIKGCYIFSSGKNMGVFTAGGFPEDVGRFYRLDESDGYLFTAHGRYPTNTPGWWGGAHPFALLDYSVVHNGEISSYDANRRAIEMHGYKCTLLTDTEVITYIIDYLHRKKKLTLREIAIVMAAPFWKMIDKMPERERKTYEYLRNVFSSQLITGPFSIIVGFEGGMMALNDRLKLRSLVAAEKDDMLYVASEEAAIRRIEPNLDRIWAPGGGEPVIATLQGGEQNGR